MTSTGQNALCACRWHVPTVLQGQTASVVRERFAICAEVKKFRSWLRSRWRSRKQVTNQSAGRDNQKSPWFHFIMKRFFETYWTSSKNLKHWICIIN